MSRLNEYNRDFGIVFDELDDLINSIPVGGGGESTIVEEPVKDALLDTKTIKGVTYKMYKRADGSVYVLNGDTGKTMEGSFADNDLAGTGSSGDGKPPKDIVYKGDKAYREAPNGALTRTPEFDLEPEKPATTAIQSPALRQFFEGRQSKDIPVGATSATGPVQADLLSRGDIESASATPGLQRGDVLGFLPNYLIPAQAALPADTNLPITAGGIYGEKGSPLGLTPLDASLTGTNPQFIGAAGRTNLRAEERGGGE